MMYVNMAPRLIIIGITMMVPGEPVELLDEYLENSQVQDWIHHGDIVEHKEDAAG